MDLHGEGLEARFGIEGEDGDVVNGVEKGPVFRKPHIEDALPIGSRTADKRSGKIGVILDAVHLPYDVVTRPQSVNDPVEAVKARALPFYQSHKDLTPIC